MDKLYAPRKHKLKCSKFTQLQGPSRCKRLAAQGDMSQTAQAQHHAEGPAQEQLRQFVTLDGLLSQRKLFLVLDLDHTLLHTVRFAKVRPDEALLLSHLLHDPSCDIHKLPVCSIFTKLRPFVHDLLSQASSMFEMCIYTMGSHAYAKAMVHLLDPSRRIFGDRIISRDSNVRDSRSSKTLNSILAPVPATVILDDSCDIWPDSLANLIQINRYHFFDSGGKQSHVQVPSLLASLEDESPTGGALAYTLNLLRKVHHAFYGDIGASIQGSAISEKDVRQILHGLRSNLLVGCRISFCGVFPSECISSSDPKAHPLWLKAEELGAMCSTTLDGSITHVLAFHAETEAARWAACYLDCYIVHPLWIEATYYTWNRAAESEYCAMNVTPTYATFSKTTSLSMLLQNKPLTRAMSLKVPVPEKQSCDIDAAGGGLISTVQCC